MGTKAKAEIKGCGTVILNVRYGSGVVPCKFENVLHVPSFEYSLLSVSTMTKNGMKVTFGSDKCEISNHSQVLATGILEGSLYFLKGAAQVVKNESAHIASLQLWHERLAHVNHQGVSSMVSRGIVRGVKIGTRSQIGTCVGCISGKAHRSVIPKERTSERATGILDLVHTDVCGPIEVASVGQSRYFVTFIDDHSGWVCVFPMKHKSETSECYLSYEKFSERETGRKIRTVRSDRGGEYLSDYLQTHFASNGINHELTASYTPHQNGVAERMNRTLLELVRSMIHHRSVPKQMWAEALATAVYVRNRVTSRVIPSHLTPYHIWKKETPILSNLRVFGCKCWYVVPKKFVSKLDERSAPAIFVGYATRSKAYKLIDIATHGMLFLMKTVIPGMSQTPRQ